MTMSRNKYPQGRALKRPLDVRLLHFAWSGVFSFLDGYTFIYNCLYSSCVPCCFTYFCITASFVFFLHLLQNIHRSKTILPTISSLPQDVRQILSLQLCFWLLLWFLGDSCLALTVSKKCTWSLSVPISKNEIHSFLNSISIHVCRMHSSTLSSITTRRYFAGHTKWYTRFDTLCDRW